MTVSERFLNYVSFDTQSDEFSETCPSTPKQRVLGAALVEEMKQMGISDAHMDEDGYVYGTVPGDPELPTIGLIATWIPPRIVPVRTFRPRLWSIPAAMCA